METEHVIAETGRLKIRLMIEPDVPVLASMWADAQVTRFMGGPRVFGELCAAFTHDLKAPPPKLDLWPVAQRGSGVVMGHCGLLPKKVDGSDEVELVYVIATAFWGRGYATEAAAAIRDYGFRSLNIVRLVSLIDPSNTASEKVALKVGMKFAKETVRPSGKTLKVYAVAS